MKILFIIDGLRSGGKERRALSLIQRLVKFNDYNIELILLNNEIHFESVYNLGIPIHIINRSEKSKFEVLHRILFIKRQFNPDITHAWDTLSTIYSIPFTLMNSTKLITSKITDAPPNYIRNSIYGLLSEICFRYSDFILANSYAGLNIYKVNPLKSRVIYNGYDFNRLKSISIMKKEHEELNSKYKYVVSMVASFSFNKDFKTFLIAAHRILQDMNDIAFLCIGDGVLRAELEQSYNHKHIYFLGRRNDVENFIHISDIGVLLSTNGEGVSNSLMEFMAQGKPVIASNFNGNKELVLDRKTGYILQSNNSKELSEKILYLLSNRNIRFEMGKESRIRIEKSFALDRMVEEFTEVYEMVLRK